jgi:murein tripeptide amidase MpaA
MKFSQQWLTHFERSGFISSPRYKESISYFKQFEKQTPHVKMFSIGTSPQGRSIECIVVAKGKEFTPDKAKKSGKAIVLIQNGIHAGEIEGKDASMILLRDILITKEKFHLLDHLILLIIPILSVDGHERISQFNRPNQNGPTEMGWRTNSWNLNLNRDYMKADTPEVKAFLTLFNNWMPDFFIDNHTTNGADYQYHVTYALDKFANIDSGLSHWGTKRFLPYLLKNVEEKGFLAAPYIEMKEETLENGIIDPVSPPRLSTGYTSVQNRLGLLVETHSLKPYENRVRSTFAMNVATLEFLNLNHKSLKALNEKADVRTEKLKSIPVKFELSENHKPFQFKGFKSSYEESTITGNIVTHYSNEPIEFEIPLFDDVQITKHIQSPKAYLIPSQFEWVVRLLELHGVKTEYLSADRQIMVEEYTFETYKFSSKPYEGRYCVEVTCRSKKEKIKIPKGTFLVHTHQRTKRVIVNLLEPEAPDSIVSWGFFNAFFERKEYAEPYVMEPIAQQMLGTNIQLRSEFLSRLKDEKFRNDSVARLDFFYQRSPFFDINERKYPIYRVV